MKPYLKQLIFLLILAVVFTIGVFVVTAVNNRGNAPVAFWKFDEGAGPTAYDSAGANDGTITNALWRNEPDCLSGKCLYFDGTGDYVDAGTDSSLNFTTQNFTISFWIRLNDVGSKNIIYRSTGTDGYFIQTGSTNILYLKTNNTVRAQTTSALATNTWYYVAAVYNQTSNIGQIYLNGIPQTSSTAPNVTGASTSFYISYTSSAVNGFLDDIRIYDYARSSAQIKADYSGGTRGLSAGTVPKATSQAQSQGLVAHWKMDETALNACGTAQDACDSSGGSNNLSAQGDATATSAAKYGYATTYDGTGDYYCSDTNDDGACEDDNDLDMGTSDFTIEAWVNSGSVTSQGIIYKISSGGTGYYLLLNSSGYIQCGIQFSGAGKLALASSNTVADSAWHHVTGVMDRDAYIKVFVDGVEVTSYSQQDNPSSLSSNDLGNTDTLAIGTDSRNLGNNLNFTGKIDDVRIYKTARSAEQIRLDYETGPPPVAHWKMDEKTGTTVQDSSGNAKTGTIKDCPRGWVLAPGSSTYGTSNFCVMQYEAKYDADGNGAGDDAPTNCRYNTNYDTWDWGKDVATGCGYNVNEPAKVVSSAGGSPIAGITHTQALTACPTGSHIITNDEWMTIARNAEQVAANWVGGVVGTNCLFRGNTGETTTEASCGYNGDEPEKGTGRNAKAKLMLSNGSEIYDIAGNIWEHVKNGASDTLIRYTPSDGGALGWKWLEFTDITDYGDLSYNQLRPSTDTWNSTQGVGQVYTYNGDYGNATCVFLRGGGWNDGTSDGAFALILHWSASSQGSVGGLRCSR